VALSHGVLPPAGTGNKLTEQYLVLIGQLRSARSGSRDLPTGSAVARATISNSGIVRITGKLADGEVFTATSHLDEHGGFDLYDLPYKSPRGILAGRVQLDANSGTGTGTLWWFKPAQARGTDRSGFEGLATVAISGLVQ
jgi:hypothetical protein